jgi:hypothetical protein
MSAPRPRDIQSLLDARRHLQNVLLELAAAGRHFTELGQTPLSPLGASGLTATRFPTGSRGMRGAFRAPTEHGVAGPLAAAPTARRNEGAGSAAARGSCHTPRIQP